jgi:putative peptidoglycan lipid II flippase
MGVVVWITARALEPVLQMDGLRLLGLVVILLVAVGSYALAGRLLGAFNFAELRQMIRRSD